MFPKEWQLCKIGDIAETTSGGTPNRKNKEYYDGNISWVKSGELEDGDIYSTEEKITEEALKKSSAKLFPKGTLLIAMYGATVGKTSILQIDATTNQAVCAIFPSEDLANAHFLRYYFIYSRPTLLRQRYGGAQPNISQTVIRNFEVSLPPISEQYNIAHILSIIQSAIEAQEKIIQTTTELKKALMQKLFTEGLNGEQQKEAEIGLVPRSWEVKRIEEVYNFTNKPRGTDLGVVKQVPFIPMDLIPDDGLFVRDFELRDVDDLSSGTYIENGDLLIAKITPSFENGKQAIVDFEYKFGFATTEVLPIKEKAKISNKYYLYYYLLKNDVRSMLAGKMEGSTGRQRLSKTVLGETLIPCPSYKEQTEIAEMFIKVDNKIQFCKTKVVSLQSLFKSMLHHLMTGQIRVKDLKVS